MLDIKINNGVAFWQAVKFKTVLWFVSDWLNIPPPHPIKAQKKENPGAPWFQIWGSLHMAIFQQFQCKCGWNMFTMMLELKDMIFNIYYGGCGARQWICTLTTPRCPLAAWTWWWYGTFALCPVTHGHCCSWCSYGDSMAHYWWSFWPLKKWRDTSSLAHVLILKGLKELEEALAKLYGSAISLVC